MQRPHSTTPCNSHTSPHHATTTLHHTMQQPHPTTPCNSHTPPHHATTTLHHTMQQPHSTTPRNKFSHAAATLYYTMQQPHSTTTSFPPHASWPHLPQRWRREVHLDPCILAMQHGTDNLTELALGEEDVLPRQQVAGCGVGEWIRSRESGRCQTGGAPTTIGYRSCDSHVMVM